MRASIGPILFAGLTIALWLALGMPVRAFFEEAWIPAVAWILFGILASSPGALARSWGVDMPTYGTVALAFGAVVPAVGALLAAGMMLGARYLGTGSQSLGYWAISPLLGALFVVLLVLSIAPFAILSNRTLGARGADPLVDPRQRLRSHPPSSKSEAEFEAANHASSDETRD